MAAREDKEQGKDSRRPSIGSLNGSFKGSNGRPIRSPFTPGLPHQPSSDQRKSLEALNERSPLLVPRRSMEGDHVPKVMSPLADDDNDDDYLDDSHNEDHGEESKSTWHLFLLTLTIGG